MGAYFFHFLFHAFNFQDLYVVLNVFRMYYHETVFVQQQQSKPCFYLEKKQGDIMMGSFDEGGLCFFFVCLLVPITHYIFLHLFPAHTTLKNTDCLLFSTTTTTKHRTPINNLK